MLEAKEPKSLEEILPQGSTEYIHIPAKMTDNTALPTEMANMAVNTDIVRMDLLTTPAYDCTFHPNGYCFHPTQIFYEGPVMIACQPPFAYIRWTKKSRCAV